MRLYLLPLLILLTPRAVFSQKNFPAFGKIDKPDLEMTDCTFDPGAVACKLIDWGSVHYERGVGLFQQVTERRIRIKILKQKGTGYANVKIPFYSRNNNQKISKLEANTYNLDAGGNIISTSVDKKSIYTRAINKAVSETIFTFPEVKVGSVIEYKYKLESDYYQDVADWYFQDEIPTVISQYELKAPRLFKFREDPFIYMDAERTKEITDENMTLGDGQLFRVSILNKTYVLRNVPGIHDEPYQTTKKDYMQRISFELSQIDFGDGDPKDIRTSWEDVRKKLMQHEDFGEELKKNIPGTETFVATLKARCNDTLCKMIGIYNYVRSNMNWNGSEFIYANQGIRTAWDKKTGNTGEINLILIKLLRDAGVEAKPILFSTRDNGIVNSFYPSESQFNAVMAWVQIAGEYYILNGADKYNSYKLVPEEVAYSKGFLLGEESGSWRNIVKPDQFFKQLVAIEAYIEETGTLKGTATVNSLNYARNPLTKAYLEDKAEFKEMYFVKPYNKITVSQLDVTNAENDTLGLQQKLSFSMPLSSSGNYKYFTINLFSGLTENPFIADERQTDIDFGYPQQFDLYGNYKIPAGYIFDELPKSMMMIMPDTSISFSRYISVEDNALSVRIMLEFSKPFYSAADYDYFKEFYKKLLGKLNEQIVIKKK